MGMKYELSSPMVFGSPDSDEYRDGWDRIFGKKATMVLLDNGEWAELALTMPVRSVVATGITYEGDANDESKEA